MTIIELKAQNLGILKAVNIRAEGKNSIIISGRNGQGKSTVLNAIAYALGGKDAFKKIKKPIRNGEDRAEIIVTTDKYIVTRWWTSDENSYLKVTSPDGASYANPQNLLDKLVGDLSFDPLEFARMKDDDQKEALMTLAGIDIKATEAKRKEKFDERTLVNRQIKQVEAQLASMPVHEGEIPDMVDVSELMTKLNEINDINAKRVRANERIIELENTIAKESEIVDELKRKIIEYQNSIKAGVAQKGLVNEWLDKNPEQDPQPIQQKINDASRVDQIHRDLTERLNKAKEHSELKEKSMDLTLAINDIDVENDLALGAAKLPIEGLGVDEDCVTFQGIPFNQLSDAEKLKVSVAIAMAKNPTLRVIHIKNGSLLDRDSMDVIESLAKDNDYQVWIERVEDSVGIKIEDGEVVDEPETA